MFLNKFNFEKYGISENIIVTWDVFKCIFYYSAYDWEYNIIVTWDVFKWESWGFQSWVSNEYNSNMRCF